MRAKTTGLWSFWFLICFCAVLVALIIVGVAASEPKTRIRRDCAAGGYADYEMVGRTLVCVGIRDGAYVVESLDDVRARLEGE